MEYFITDKLTCGKGVDYAFELPPGQRVVSVIGTKKSRAADYYILTLLIEKDPMKLPLTELR